MAGTTPNFNLPYSEIDDDTDGPAQIKALADRLDAVLTAAKVGVGAALTDTGITVSTASGWGSLTYRWQPVNGDLVLTITATRTGSTITADAGGNIPDTLVATLADHRPPMNVPALYLSNGGTSGGCVLGTDGKWTISDAHPTSTIVGGGSGNTVSASFVYPY